MDLKFIITRITLIFKSGQFPIVVLLDETYKSPEAIWYESGF